MIRREANENGKLNHIGNYYDYGTRGIQATRTNLWALTTPIPQIYNTDNKFVTAGSDMTPTVAQMNADNDLMWGQYQDGDGGLYGDRLPSSYFIATQHTFLGRAITPVTADQALIDRIDSVGCNKRLNADGSVSSNIDVLDADALNQMVLGNYVDELIGAARVPTPFTSVERPAGFYVNSPDIPETYYAANVSPNLATDIAPSGYTWLEEYLNQVDN